MIYNENGILVNRSFITIDGERFDMGFFKESCIHEDVASSDKFKKLMDDIKKEVEECDDENLKKQKCKGVFLSIKIKKILAIASLIPAGASLVNLALMDSGINPLKNFIIGVLFGLTSLLLAAISTFPRKEMKLIYTADDVVRYYDKLTHDESLSDKVRENAMEKARKLAVKINKARQALAGNPWWENVDWGISSDILLKNRYVYFTNNITNTYYEENKEYMDSAIREINKNYDKIMKIISKKIKTDYKTNSNITALTADDIYNALGIYAADIALNGQKITVNAYICEKDSFDKSAKNIPVVLGKVIRVQFIYANNKLSYDYFETDMRTYG